MAEAVVSVAVETFRDLLLEEAKFLSGVGNEVRELQTQLKQMQSLLKDADRKQHESESESVRNWIVQIRDLAYRAEDVIETYAVRVSSKRGGGGGLRNLIRRYSCIFNECYSLHQIGSDISQIRSELELVDKSLQTKGITRTRSIMQGESSTNSNQQWKKGQTFHQLPMQDCFVGKDNELKEIVSRVVDHNDQHRVVSVWGMGGLGKTTIARKVFHHDDVARYFQGLAWVCITQKCEIRSVLEEVLSKLNPTKSKNDISTLNNTELIEELCQIQKAKRCFIVLDDLWETDHWEELKHAFLVQDSKSKILVTTRKQEVANIGFSIKLGLLSMDSGWELLKKKAFPGTNIIPDFESEEKLFQKIGKEMVQKCGFLPLTITLLGGVLSRKKSMKEWVLVTENINAYLYRDANNTKDNKIHAILNLSYEDLPYYLKPCFLYLGLFKEDEIILVNPLIKKWVAQGMISPGNRDDESLFLVAELYLSELVSRSIVQVRVLDEDSTSGNKYLWCKLHDVVRELCLSTGRKEGFGVQRVGYQCGKLMHGSLTDTKTRHLAIQCEGENNAQVDAQRFANNGVEDACKHVRSLLLLNSNVKKIEFLDIAIDIQILKLLRVLHFQRIKFKIKKLPKGIGNLIHLRDLFFEDCELEEIPLSIGNLSYLQTLNFARSWDVRVPNVLNKLLRLKHLMLPFYSDKRVGHYALELDEGLDELETLSGFDTSVHQLKSIIRLTNLRSFGAFVHDNESLSTVIDAITTKWNKMKFASIEIEQGCEFTSTGEGLILLEKVLTCPNLLQLGIYVKIGKLLDECRNQVSSSRIMRLYLLGCEIEEDLLQILGKLHVLKKLVLRSRSFVGEVMICPEYSYPCLTELVLEALPNLREWRVEKGAMPLLSEITIVDCPNLMMLPDGLRFISSLQKLTITKMSVLGKRILASEEDGGEGQGEDFDKVRHVPSIIINN